MFLFSTQVVALQSAAVRDTVPEPYGNEHTVLDATELALTALRIAPDAEESAWLKRAQAGDVAGCDWLITRYRGRVVRLAAHILHRPAEAEDLAQEAFLRAFSQIAQFRGECAFYTWLYRIVVRTCLNRMRTPDWRRLFQWQPENPHSEWVAGPTMAEQADSRLLVKSLLDQLSPPLRSALVLREMEGLDYAEIAVALDIPVGTVRSRLNAAREQFRMLWQRAQEETNNV